MLMVIDQFTRECLAFDVSRRMTSEDVLECLSDLFVQRGPRSSSASTTARGLPLRESVSGWGRRREDTVHATRLSLGARLHRIV